MSMKSTIINMLAMVLLPAYASPEVIESLNWLKRAQTINNRCTVLGRVYTKIHEVRVDSLKDLLAALNSFTSSNELDGIIPEIESFSKEGDRLLNSFKAHSEKQEDSKNRMSSDLDELRAALSQPITENSGQTVEKGNDLLLKYKKLNRKVLSELRSLSGHIEQVERFNYTIFDCFRSDIFIKALEQLNEREIRSVLKCVFDIYINELTKSYSYTREEHLKALISREVQLNEYFRILNIPEPSRAKYPKIIVDKLKDLKATKLSLSQNDAYKKLIERIESMRNDIIKGDKTEIIGNYPRVVDGVFSNIESAQEKFTDMFLNTRDIMLERLDISIGIGKPVSKDVKVLLLTQSNDFVKVP